MISALVRAITLAEVIAMQINTMQNTIRTQTERLYILYIKGQVMPLKMIMTRCCEMVYLSTHSSDYPINLLAFLLENILLSHADFRGHD